MKSTAKVRGFLCLAMVLWLLTGCSLKTSSQGAAQGSTESPDQPAVTADAGENRIQSQMVTATLPEPPDSLDPREATSLPALRLLNAISEGLVRTNRGGRILAGSGLAERWVVDDSRTQYTFKLRETKWTDGTPLTAEDFVQAWREGVDPRNQSPHARLFFPIKNAERIYNLEDTSQIEQELPQLGVEALDAKTLQVTLERPNESFLHYLTLPAFFPKPPDRHDGPSLPAIGPFRFKETPTAKSYELVKNEQYWDHPFVRIDQISFQLIESWRERLKRFEDGTIQWIDLPLTAVQTFKDKQWIRTESQGVVWYLVFNTERAPFSDARMRKALSSAIDRLELSKTTLQQGAVPATGLTPPGIMTPQGESFASLVNMLPERADLEQAKDLMQSVAGTKSTISLVGAKEVEPLLQEIATMWKNNLGLEVQVFAEDTQTRINRAIRGDFEVMVDYWVADYNDPLTFLRLMVSEGLFNDSGWGMEQFDQLVEKGHAETDAIKRFQAMLQAEQLLLAPDVANNMPIAPLYWPVKYYAATPRLDGVIYSPVGSDVDFKYAYYKEG